MSGPQIVVGEFYGWRRWHLALDRDGAPLLKSPHYSMHWTGPTMTSDKVPALTEAERHPPKVENEKDDDGLTLTFRYGALLFGPAGAFEGQHGIHAHRKAAGLAATDAEPTLCATGVVALSGVVVEGEHGYRAERATIQALWLHWPTMHQMARRKTRPGGWRAWADWRPLDVIAALEDRYQCPVAMYRPGAHEGWAP